MAYRFPQDEGPGHVETLVRVDLTRLELACAHDGMLRGRPEPVVVFGFYLVAEGVVRLLERRVCHFEPPSRFPSTVAPRGAQRMDLLLNYRLPAMFACLALGLEVDSGAGLTALYGRTERPMDFLFELENATEEGARDFLAIASRGVWAAVAQRCQLRVGGEPVAHVVRYDDWVGASLYCFGGAERHEATARMHLRADDARNDWTLSAFVRLRSPHPWCSR